MGKQHDGPFQRPGRADVLAERGQRDVVHQPVDERKGDDEGTQRDILQAGQRPGDPVFTDLQRRDFAEELLQKAQRSEPAADRLPQGDAEHIERRHMARGRQRVLQGAKGAGPYSAGAGIAVKPRYADCLCAAGIEGACHKAFRLALYRSYA